MSKNKAIHFKIQKSQKHALLVQVDEMPYFYSQLHYHPEFQITAIVKGEGFLYAGNAMTAFVEGDVFIVGSNVPHLFQNSGIYHSEASPGVKGISLFFDEFSFGQQFFAIKEMQRLSELLGESNRVIKVADEHKELLFNRIISTPKLQDERLVITFLEILSLLQQSDKNYLNSAYYKLTMNTHEGGRLSKVLDYTFQNYKEDIKIEQIAQVASLSRSQFSNFFKLHTRKTYIQFVNELRIEKACIALRNNRFTIEQICYEVGFHNVSNFFRHFKKIKGTTPSQYRKSWMIKP